MSKRIILIALAFITVSAISFFAGWLIRPIWGKGLYKTVADIPDPFLASDKKTGDYLGVVISECSEWEGKRPISYKIQMASGKTIEKPADSVNIYTP